MLRDRENHIVIKRFYVNYAKYEILRIQTQYANSKQAIILIEKDNDNDIYVIRNK